MMDTNDEMPVEVKITVLVAIGILIYLGYGFTKGLKAQADYMECAIPKLNDFCREQGFSDYVDSQNMNETWYTRDEVNRCFDISNGFKRYSEYKVDLSVVTGCGDV